MSFSFPFSNCFEVFQHDSIHIKYDVENDQYSIIAKQDIEEGTILKIEKVIVSTKEKMYDLFCNCSDLSNFIEELYPRISYQEMDQHNLTKETVYSIKCESNCWDDGNNKISVCFGLSTLNHSCTPNSFISEVCTNNENYNILVAIQSIKKEEEICIMYNELAGHVTSETGYTPFTWECPCKFSKDERLNTFNRCILKSKQYVKEQNDSILDLIYDYEKQCKLEPIKKYFFESIHSHLHPIYKDKKKSKRKMPDIERLTILDSSDLLFACENGDESLFLKCFKKNVECNEEELEFIKQTIEDLIDQSDEYHHLFIEYLNYRNRRKKQLINVNKC